MACFRILARHRAILLLESLVTILLDIPVPVEGPLYRGRLFLPFQGQFTFAYYRLRQMLIGYAWVSKVHGSQSLDLQRDALIAAGVGEDQIYSD